MKSITFAGDMPPELTPQIVKYFTVREVEIGATTGMPKTVL
jgi:hypothetical protein